MILSCDLCILIVLLLWNIKKGGLTIIVTASTAENYQSQLPCHSIGNHIFYSIFKMLLLVMQQ